MFKFDRFSENDTGERFADGMITVQMTSLKELAIR